MKMTLIGGSHRNAEVKVGRVWSVKRGQGSITSSNFGSGSHWSSVVSTCPFRTQVTKE